MAMRSQYQSIKLGRTVFLDSLHEFQFAHWLDYIPEITYFVEAHKHRREKDPDKHCVKIDYTDEKGKERKYIPDFIIETNWMTVVAEIKPADQVKKIRNRLKFEAAETYCKKRGWFFIVVTTEMMDFGVEDENIRLLIRYGRFSIKKKETEIVLDVLGKLGGTCTVIDLINAVPYENKNRIRSTIYHAACHNKIRIPVSGQKICDATILSFANGGCHAI